MHVRGTCKCEVREVGEREKRPGEAEEARRRDGEEKEESGRGEGREGKGGQREEEKGGGRRVTTQAEFLKNGYSVKLFSIHGEEMLLE